MALLEPSELDDAVGNDLFSVDFLEGVAVDARVVVSMGL